MQPSLPARHEWVELQTLQCPRCGLKLKPFPGTEDAEIVELEVKAYRRVIHRKRYARFAAVAACPPARLINRGKFGISVWTQVLPGKFAYGRPSQRLVQDLADHDLQMSPGTLAGWPCGRSRRCLSRLGLP